MLIDEVPLQAQHQTSDREVAGSTPAWALLRKNLWQVVHTPCDSVTNRQTHTDKCNRTHYRQEFTGIAMCQLVDKWTVVFSLSQLIQRGESMAHCSAGLSMWQMPPASDGPQGVEKPFVRALNIQRCCPWDFACKNLDYAELMTSLVVCSALLLSPQLQSIVACVNCTTVAGLDDRDSRLKTNIESALRVYVCLMVTNCSE